MADKAGLIQNNALQQESSFGKPSSSSQQQQQQNDTIIDMPQQQQQDQNAITQIFKASSHPRILLFHLAFKLAAIIVYILADWIIKSFVVSFIVIALMLAFDFWTVKNVSGRYLVGLRWWSAEQDGKQAWQFESRPANYPLNATDSRVFWWTLYGTGLVWVLLLVVLVIQFKFTWLPLVLLAMSLNSANLVGYRKCAADRKSRNAPGGLQMPDVNVLSGFANLTKMFGQ